MKRGLVLTAIVLVLVAVITVMSVEISHSQVEKVSTNYNYIQSQPTTGDFDSPVIHDTLSQIGSAIFG